MSPLLLSSEQARRYLVGQMGLARNTLPRGAAGVRALLARRRVIQLDPLDPIGTNADLVAAARVDGLRRGDVYRHLLPGHAFEHFAKERCLLPADQLPGYRARALATPWWRLSQRLKRVPASLCEEVLAEIRERGPLSPAELTDRGRVQQIDWSGWKGTGKAATMACEILWTRVQLVVCGRRRGQKVYDLPERALPTAWALPLPDPEAYARQALLDRVEAAGLLATAGGPWWSSLAPWRTLLPTALLRSGTLIEVQLPGSRRRYLAPPDVLERSVPEPDGRMRILGPLDPLLWNRPLVQLAFGFEYLWEVYKPKAQRRWGWYVCPLLYRGQLVGRIDARTETAPDGAVRMVVDRLWKEPGRPWSERAWQAARRRHERFLQPRRAT